MSWMIGLAVLACVAILTWVAQEGARGVMQRYRAAFTESARLRMSEFFLFVDAEYLWVFNIVGVGILALFFGLATQSWLAAGLGAGGGLLLPQYVVKKLRQRRIQRFDAQLPDALLALGSALRSGASLQAGLRQIAAEGQAPLAQEFGLMMREQRFGLGMEESLNNLYLRVPTETTNLVVCALGVAAETGGNLAETLERIASTVRARLHMEGRIRALTAQGRLQARVVAILPLLMIAVLHRLEPETMQLLWTSTMGWAVLATVLLLDFLGLWLIRKIVRIDV